MSEDFDLLLKRTKVLFKSAKDAFERGESSHYNYIRKRTNEIIEKINNLEKNENFYMEKLPEEIYHRDQINQSYRAIWALKEIQQFLLTKTEDKDEKIKELENRIENLQEEKKELLEAIKNFDNIKTSQKLEKILNNFHKIAKKLEKRYDDRKTLEIEDEHDVQDLLEALLNLEFSDIRSEEPVPSHAGGGSNIDFLLKNYGIGIEIKHTTSDDDRRIGEELTTDIQKYKQHPNVEKLICFIYNPKYALTNPEGLKKELNDKSDDELHTEVYIKPD